MIYTLRCTLWSRFKRLNKATMFLFAANKRLCACLVPTNRSLGNTYSTRNFNFTRTPEDAFVFITPQLLKYIPFLPAAQFDYIYDPNEGFCLQIVPNCSPKFVTWVRTWFSDEVLPRGNRIINGETWLFPLHTTIIWVGPVIHWLVSSFLPHCEMNLNIILLQYIGSYTLRRLVVNL